MSTLPWGALILALLSFIAIVALIIPKTRKSIFSFLDRIDSAEKKMSLKFRLNLSFKLPNKGNSRTTDKHSTVQEFIRLLNENHPSTKEEIKTVFIAVYGGKIVPTIRKDYESDKDIWLILFNPPERGSPNVQVLQTEDGIWVERKKKSY